MKNASRNFAGNRHFYARNANPLLVSAKLKAAGFGEKMDRIRRQQLVRLNVEKAGDLAQFQYSEHSDHAALTRI
ncbi:MAG: hypothetical protein ACE5HO_12520 [bacterium]